MKCYDLWLNEMHFKLNLWSMGFKLNEMYLTISVIMIIMITVFRDLLIIDLYIYLFVCFIMS